MTHDQTTSDGSDQSHRLRTNVALYVGVLVLAFATVLGGVLKVWPAVQDRMDGQVSSHEASEPTKEDISAGTYRDILAAATAHATAFVNLDYRKIDESVDSVTDKSTGAFAKQYAKSGKGLRTLMKRNHSVMTGSVLSAGVVSASDYTARVLVATNGTVRNKSTKNKAVERNLRLQLDLTKTDDRWLVNEVQFVG
ncbi:hypothetical protein ASG90_08145 [Nocardioides sp. Soil797]|nr:hypothetical protein ASG90_08145 [Nocardioides sp. Soil797]